MKNTLFTIVLLVFAMTAFAAERIVENPLYVVTNTRTIKIEKVMMTDEATVLDIHALYRPGNWIRIGSDTYLKVGDRKYAIKSSEGIKLDSEHYMPASGECDFTLTFEPLPLNTERFDFIEGDCETCFKIWGVELTDAGIPELVLDPVFRNQKLDYNAPLPKPVMTSGNVRIKGRVLDWKTGMPNYYIMVTDLMDTDDNMRKVVLTADADGMFDIELPLEYTQFVVLTNDIRSMRTQLALSPGETVTLNINQRPDQPGKAPSKRCYIDGRYAALTDKINTSPLWNSAYDILYAATEQLSGADIYQYRDRMISVTDSLIKEINDEPNINVQIKSLTECKVRHFLLYYIELRDYFLKQAFRRANNLMDHRGPLPGFKPLEKPGKEYYDFIKQYNFDNEYAFCFSEINEATDYISRIPGYFSPQNFDMILEYITSAGLLTPEDTKAIEDFQANPSEKTAKPMSAALNRLQPQITEFQKTVEPVKISDFYNVDQGFVSDLVEVAQMKSNIGNYTSLTEEQMAEFAAKIKHPLFVEMIKKANDKLVATIEENSKKTGYNVVDVADVAPDKLLETIIEKYKGKVIFIDFWATWCGPCRSAMVAAEPIKEQLKGRDVVFVYITNSSSPAVSWRNMIANIQGEHFMLNAEQDKHMSKTEYQYTGIPSYAIIGRDGQKKHFQTGFMGPDMMLKMLEKEL